MQLTIIGLGVHAGDISYSAIEAAKKCEKVVLRTGNTESVKVLNDCGIKFITLDYLYEKSKNFDTLTKNICAEIRKLLKTSDVCYLVDGAVSEDNSAAFLISKIKNVKVYEGVSKVGYALSVSGLSGKGYTAVSAYSVSNFTKFSLPLVVYDLDSQILASEWKLKLFSLIGEEQKVRLYARNQCFSVPMYEMDGLDVYDYSTVLVVEDLPLQDKERFNYEDLIDIVKILRSPEGCPWDRAQTKKSICKTLIEECYELVDAVEKDDDDLICEETGDVLLQTAFYIGFLEDNLYLNGSDVLTGICRKLITRHSHVFGSDNAANPDEALNVWNKNKQTEKKYETPTAYLNAVPKNFPAAMRAEKVVKRAKYYDYPVGNKEELLEKLKGLLQEFAISDNDCELLKEILFTAVALTKTCDFSAEDLLSSATSDFIEEFSKVDEAILNDKLDMKNLNETQIKRYCNEIKKS